MQTNLGIPLLVWRKLVMELRTRGGAERESGAFLLGFVGGGAIKEFIPYDELDPLALDSGIVEFRGSGYVPLFNYCREKKMQVLADVHTHGGKWTEQSEIDRTNPMIETPGHIALIIPHFAQRNSASLRGVGVFEYLGNHEWQKWTTKSGRVSLTLV